ncbi:hypothetical protein PCE1_004862 [Barthelona sp. PCE]
MSAGDGQKNSFGEAIDFLEAPVIREKREAFDIHVQQGRRNGQSLLGSIRMGANRVNVIDDDEPQEVEGFRKKAQIVVDPDDESDLIDVIVVKKTVSAPPRPPQAKKPQVKTAQARLDLIVAKSDETATMGASKVRRVVIKNASELSKPQAPSNDRFSCPICFGSSEDGIYAMPCGHLVCSTCLPYLEQRGRRKCPLCRRPYTTATKLYIS